MEAEESGHQGEVGGSGYCWEGVGGSGYCWEEVGGSQSWEGMVGAGTVGEVGVPHLAQSVPVPAALALAEMRS